MAKEKFEDALEKLEDIVRKMKAGYIPLNEALKSFEEGKIIRGILSFKNIEYYAVLLAASVVFLVIQRLTHIEFFLHLAAIPIEILAAVFIVEKFLEKRETKEKRRQLMYIKSYLFRSEIRDLFIANFHALKSPPLSVSKIKDASLEELRQMRVAAEKIEYASPEAMEPVITEYVRAERVWNSFLERAITYNFEEIFLDMIYIIHFVCDVKAFKERNPDQLFMSEALSNQELMSKVQKILWDGIQRFLDYAIELKEKQPSLFSEMLLDYELSTKIRHSERKRRDEKRQGRFVPEGDKISVRV